MNSFIINNVTAVLPDQLKESCAVVIENGQIARICHSKAIGIDTNVQVIDAENCYLAPGFIELHIHGTHEFLIDNGLGDLKKLCDVLPQYGVTGFLPTVCPRKKGEDAEFLASLATINSSGAAVLGFHLEGPFLALTGALSSDAIGKADLSRVKALIKAAKPYSTIFSISPDFEDITELIKIMTSNNAPVFITHTKADVKQTQAAIEAGARHATQSMKTVIL